MAASWMMKSPNLARVYTVKIQRTVEIEVTANLEPAEPDVGFRGGFAIQDAWLDGKRVELTEEEADDAVDALAQDYVNDR